MDHTGHYHYPILKKLDDEHLPVIVMNPYVIKKYGDVQIRKAKTGLHFMKWAKSKGYRNSIMKAPSGIYQKEVLHCFSPFQ